MSQLDLGSRIEDFQCATTQNPNFFFSDLNGKNVLIYFYPKDNTPGCTKEAQAFTELYPEFQQLNTEILGVSRDSLASHEKFQCKYDIPYPLISDPDNTLCNYFDVYKEKSFMGRVGLGIVRSTFLIDEEGVLRQIWRKVKVKGHVEEVLAAVNTLTRFKA